MIQRNQFEARINRWIAAAFGVLLLLVGAPFLVLGATGIFKSFSDNPDSIITALMLGSTLIGFFCVWTGVRMAFNLRRADGGLLSPSMLRTGGVYFVSVPIFLIYMDGGFEWENTWVLLEIGFSLGLAGTCFALASRRQHPVLGGESFPNDT